MRPSKPRHGVLALVLIALSALISLLRIHRLSIHRHDFTIITDYAPSLHHSSSQPHSTLPVTSTLRRSRCQIIYLLGVEGTMHHGMQPILEKLARHQTDPNGAPFILHSPSNDLRYSLFGYPRHHFGYKVPPPLNDAQLVQKVYDAMCPNDGRHHVILESTSFPSGGKFHELRIKRQSSLWSTMSPSSIATSYSALHHPTNLYDFIETYSPLAQIQFVVLSRSFIDTVASHAQFDEGTMNHANILQGYLILLSNFLMRHRYHSLPDGMVEKVWTVVDVDKLSSKQYQDKYIMGQEHLQLVRNLTSFLNWKDSECDDCFHHWVESNMESEKVLGKRNVERLMGMVGELEGIWPPREED